MSFVIKQTSPTKFIVFKTEYNSGKPKRTSVPKLVWNDLGFHIGMSIVEAKAKASELNKKNSSEKREMQKQIRSGVRIKKAKFVDSKYTPELVCNKFEEYLKLNFVSRHKSKTKILSHWNKVIELVQELELLPKDFYSNRNYIISYLIKKTYSLDYSNKILRILNLWGEFYSEKNGSFFKPIPPLDNYDKQAINDSYFDSDSFIGPSDPITPQDLILLKDYLKESQMKWMNFSIWFGLRPSEINKLKKTASVEMKVINGKKTPVLVVYQEKLVRIERERRYKRIPAFLPEQLATLEALKVELKPPLVKTLKLHLNKKAGLYGGRKGFTDMMLGLNQKLEDISSWLGHTNINMTWRVYKDKTKVGFTEI